MKVTENLGYKKNDYLCGDPPEEEEEEEENPTIPTPDIPS